MLVSIPITLSDETFQQMLEAGGLTRLTDHNKCELQRKTLSAGIAFVETVIVKEEPTEDEISKDLEVIILGLTQMLSVTGAAELEIGRAEPAHVGSLLNRQIAVRQALHRGALARTAGEGVPAHGIAQHVSEMIRGAETLKAAAATELAQLRHRRDHRAARDLARQPAIARSSDIRASRPGPDPNLAIQVFVDGLAMAWWLEVGKQPGASVAPPGRSDGGRVSGPFIEFGMRALTWLDSQAPAELKQTSPALRESLEMSRSALRHRLDQWKRSLPPRFWSQRRMPKSRS